MPAPIDDIAQIERFLRARLTRPLPGPDAQRRFAPQPLRRGWQLVPTEARQAAALVLIYPGATGPAIPLTVRHADLPDHAGQVSLPGGKLIAGEAAAAAALREAEEEIGIDGSMVRLLGPLSSFWVVVSGFVVFPFIGVADRRPDFRPDVREVAELVEAPLSELLDPARRGWGEWARDGVPVRFPFIDIAGHKIWGATAMILGEFGTLFDPAFVAPPHEPSAR